MASKQPKSTSVRTRTSTTDVTAFMARLDHPLKAEIEALRTLIRSVDPRIQERIKWNAPSFAIHEDFATFKLYPAATVQVVLHTGAKGKPTTAEPSSGSRRRSDRTGDSPGMPSPLTTPLPRAAMVFIRKSRYPIPSGMPWATTGST
jgi:hypothetical protein